MSNAIGDLSGAEVLTNLAHDRINPNALDELCIAARLIELAAALCIVTILPVDGKRSRMAALA